ncbi:MAG: serine O-acetyltransferase [Fibrobacter sp.]|jgi:serine O-acetyltransferase|nr:serine O-acetyltransferase [Fibrobacter sp.]
MNATLTKQLKQDAELLVKSHPMTAKMLNEFILTPKTLSEILAKTLAVQLCGEFFSYEDFDRTFKDVLEKNPDIVDTAILDICAIQNRDPACSNPLDSILFYKGFHAVQIHRIAHEFWKNEERFLAKMLQSRSSQKLGVDIHPAAQIGHGILMDHATGIVIGETAVVGNDVSILHGVTLGGTGNEIGDRHPKIGNGVLLGAHAQLLGNITIGDRAKIGAGAVVLDDVPPHTTYAGVPAVQVGIPEEDTPSHSMEQKFNRCFQ